MTKQQLQETITYPLIEVYLNDFVPQGYRYNWPVALGPPRSEQFHTLAVILTYYRGGQWHIPGQGNEIYQIVDRGRKIQFFIDDVLCRFVEYINLLHNERPGYWCGDATFGEAKEALDQAKRCCLQQEQLAARQQKTAEIKAWCQQHEPEDGVSTSRYTYHLYVRVTRVMMQRIVIRSRSPFHGWVEPARRALLKVRERQWRVSSQQEIEVYNEFGQHIVIPNQGEP